VSTAGTVKHGGVVFCVPKDALSSSSSGVVEANILPAMKKNVVAVKTLRKEHVKKIRCLQRIDDTVPSELRRNFTHIIRSEELSKTSNRVWLIMEAVVPNTTMTNLVDAIQELNKSVRHPRTPALEFDLQIGPALRFLHEGLVFTRNDLKSDNVLVMLENILAIDTLRFVLINFREFSKAPKHAELQEDVRSFCSEVSRLAGAPIQADDWERDLFSRALIEHRREEHLGELMNIRNEPVTNMRKT
jgi:serine/threonine protein kinase